jgi:two-component system KDP operon response regulator KdpE
MSSKTKLLIVDDDPDIRRGLAARLKAVGYEPTFAVDAVSAISAAVRDKPDLILLDIGLPGGDGFLVMQRLQNLAPLMGVPIIIVSAREPSTHEKKAIAAGAREYFQKPIDIDRLLTAIRNALDVGLQA